VGGSPAKLRAPRARTRNMGAAVERVGGTRAPNLVGLVGKIIAQSELAGDRLQHPEPLQR
jgi:hypothetical protein